LAAERAAKQQQEEEEKKRRAANEEEARRLAAERATKQQQEEEMKKRRAENERMNEIRRKRLRIGDRVTAIGFSHDPGDALIQSVGRDGSLVLENKLLESVGRSHHGSIFTVRDPRTLSAFDEQEEDSDAIFLLCTANDKYEAAVSVFYCHCHGGFCKCTNILSADIFLPSKVDQETIWKIGQRVNVNGFADADVLDPEVWRDGRKTIKIKYDGGNVYHVTPNQLMPVTVTASEPGLPPRPILEHRGELEKFDEYKCAEKIDLRRLERMLADLRTDRNIRDSFIERLEGLEAKGLSKEKMVWLKQMQRCKVLEATAEAIYSLLKDLVRDDYGCVVHEVEYEQRDPSCQGRVFAIGRQVKVISNDKYPRTATLQGMHSDLRAPLVGEFAHDIDCENSEIRLVCSLATQLDLKDLIPIMFDYRDNRQEWLNRITDLHDVSQANAKRLPNIILSGGRYETWLRNMGLQPACPRSSNLRQQVKDVLADSRVSRSALKSPSLQVDLYRPREATKRWFC
jgi:hypothetical protein